MGVPASINVIDYTDYTSNSTLMSKSHGSQIASQCEVKERNYADLSLQSFQRIYQNTPERKKASRSFIAVFNMTISDKTKVIPLPPKLWLGFGIDIDSRGYPRYYRDKRSWQKFPTLPLTSRARGVVLLVKRDVKDQLSSAKVPDFCGNFNPDTMVSTATLEKAITLFPPECEKRKRNNTDFTVVTEFLKTCPHGKHLPKAFTDPNLDPPQLWYGFGINIEDILKYYIKTQSEYPSLPPMENDEAGLVKRVLQQVEVRLTKLCNHQITSNMILSEKYDWVISLYDSHERIELEENEEKEVIAILKTELPILQEQNEPAWFFDGDTPLD
ncbi:hypothetical protein F5880DRAFT_1615019 [Lentinula raphanica]|nr:hypothetical protein F5880DRAFT_1615019 [Lentinula raphanica]